MWFEFLHIQRLPEPDLIHALVGDEVYSGATLTWSSFGRADRLWVLQELENVFAWWAPQGSVDLATSWYIEPVDQDSTPPDDFVLTLQCEAAPVSKQLLSALPETRRAQVRRTLDDLLLTFQALLIIP